MNSTSQHRLPPSQQTHFSPALTSYFVPDYYAATSAKFAVEDQQRLPSRWPLPFEHENGVVGDAVRRRRPSARFSAFVNIRSPSAVPAASPSADGGCHPCPLVTPEVTVPTAFDGAWRSAPEVVTPNPSLLLPRDASHPVAPDSSSRDWCTHAPLSCLFKSNSF